MSGPHPASTVAELLAKQAITDALYRYCRGLDRMDRDMVLSVWHNDSTADYGAHYHGSGPGFVDWVWPAHGNFERHSHQITNVLIELVDDDHAVSEACDTHMRAARVGSPTTARAQPSEMVRIPPTSSSVGERNGCLGDQ